MLVAICRMTFEGLDWRRRIPWLAETPPDGSNDYVCEVGCCDGEALFTFAFLSQRKLNEFLQDLPRIEGPRYKHHPVYILEDAEGHPDVRGYVGFQVLKVVESVTTEGWRRKL